MESLSVDPWKFLFFCGPDPPTTLTPSSLSATTDKRIVTISQTPDRHLQSRTPEEILEDFPEKEEWSLLDLTRGSGLGNISKTQNSPETSMTNPVTPSSDSVVSPNLYSRSRDRKRDKGLRHDVVGLYTSVKRTQQDIRNLYYRRNLFPGDSVRGV